MCSTGRSPANLMPCGVVVSSAEELGPAMLILAPVQGLTGRISHRSLAAVISSISDLDMEEIT